MKLYSQTGNIKAGLFMLGISLIIGLLTYTQLLVQNLREDNREIVRLYASLIANVVQEESDTNLDFIFENIIQKVKFPLIQTDIDNRVQMWKNLPEDITTQGQIHNFMIVSDKHNEPIPLTYKDGKIGEITFGYLHYGDSAIVRKIQVWSYIEIIAIGVFILLGFSGFTFIRNNEKKHIWVGMSRETAHQLGTPVSALLGWIDLLKEDESNAKDIIPELESDIDRLQQISRRFSKMGSKPDIEEINISNKIENILFYLSKRIPVLGNKIQLINDINSGIIIKANGTLLSWAIENLIRNSIDSIGANKGIIRINLIKTTDEVKIKISDNGCGIPKKDWKNIFRPGFSTKSTGWGLGLSLCQRIIKEVHNGTISILSSEVNSGTVLEVNIPAV